jgi:hypothetical protein
MKKDYMKPEGKVVAMNLNENIATSGSSDTYGMKYRLGADGVTKYIYTSDYVACDTDNERFNRFYDLVASYIYGIDPNCRSDADGAQ